MNRDGYLSPIDALQVINCLNRGDGEGEGSEPTVSAYSLATAHHRRQSTIRTANSPTHPLGGRRAREGTRPPRVPGRLSATGFAVADCTMIITPHIRDFVFCRKAATPGDLNDLVERLFADMDDAESLGVTGQ